MTQMPDSKVIYALDFDGVICDSAVETAITGWKTAGQIWTDMPKDVPPDTIDRFRKVRPIIETGYEAILTMRLLFLGESVDSIFKHHAEKNHYLMQQVQVTADDLKQRFGDTRDQWIADELDGWIRMNPLFDGVAEKLRKLGQQDEWYVITTKQERFVKHIFQANDIELVGERIFGLDRNLSKPEILKDLVRRHQNQTILFVEDRLPTLLNVSKQPELASVKLIFALWGYNTDEDKAQAALQPFRLQQLDDFLVFP